MINDDDHRPGLSRRRLLTGAGAAGAGLVAASAGVLPGFTGLASAASGAPANSGLFGRLFPQLAPFASVNSRV